MKKMNTAPSLRLHFEAFLQLLVGLASLCHSIQDRESGESIGGIWGTVSEIDDARTDYDHDLAAATASASNNDNCL